MPSGDQNQGDPEVQQSIVSGDLGDGHGHGGIHLPDMSYYPFIVAAGIAIFAVGFLTHWGVIIAGAPIFVWGTLGWSMEPVNDPE